MGYLAFVQRLPTWVPVSPRLCLDSNLPSFEVSNSTGGRLSYIGLSGFPLSIPQGQQSPHVVPAPPRDDFFTEPLLYEAGPGPSEQQSFEILRWPAHFLSGNKAGDQRSHCLEAYCSHSWAAVEQTG